MIHQPLSSLEAWVDAFEKADIPILPESVAELALLRQIEDARGDMDAHTLAENLSADPLMTLKVLVHVSRYCTRLSIEPPETLVGAIVMQGVGPFFTAFEHPTAVTELLADQPDALEGLHAVLPTSRWASHSNDRTRTPRSSTRRRNCMALPKCCFGASHRGWP